MRKRRNGITTTEYYKLNREHLHLFTVFSIYGSTEESKKFYSKLAELLYDKRKESISLTVNWLRSKLCFVSARQ